MLQLDQAVQLDRGFLLFSVVVLARVPCLARGASFEHDETCLIQNHRDLVTSVRMPLGSPRNMPSKADAAEPKPIHNKDSVPKYPSHPLWKPEWWRMTSEGALSAGACLFLAGILCCAGGIGGGGIYVTVLMVFGQLSVHDAIPLSKVVVLAASVPSMILNLLKTVTEDAGENQPNSLVDWNLCRVVVPWALIGTKLGVFLNRVVPGKILVGLLCTILLGLIIMILRTGYQQHCKEREDEEAARSTSPEPAQEEQNSGNSGHGAEPPAGLQAQKLLTCEGAKDLSKSENKVTNLEMFLVMSMLFVIIHCSTLHYFSEQCEAARSSHDFACNHPIAQVLAFGQMPNFKRAGLCLGAGMTYMFVGMAYCGVLASCSTLRVLWSGQVYGSLHHFKSIGNSYKVAIVGLYAVVSLLTGCMAGLLGIGGGLIFSPLFIEARLDPHIAVATSTACVLFIAASTTFQYLLSDRVIVSLVFSFCIPHLAAAYTGTKIVHYIQDHYGAKKSWITWIVALGVGISFVLALGKLFKGGPVVTTVSD